MRTTVDLDPRLLEQIEEITGEKSPSKAVNKALSEFIRKQKLAEFRQWIASGEIIGTLNDTLEEDKARELEDMRKNLQ